MTKIFMRLSFFAMIFFVLASCSRKLRPTASVAQKPNTVNTNVDKNTVQRSSNNTNGFLGTLVPDVVYGTAPNYQGTSQQLTLDVYKPANAGDKKFPVVVLIHGGSFTGGNKNGLASTCSKLANNGYVAVSINYRLGWGFVSKAAAACTDTSKLKQAMYRGIQDAHTALDFLAAHADEYNIDKDWVFIGGQSAGAITALATAYLKEKDEAAFFDSGDEQQFGKLYKESDYSLKGVISMWGAFLNPELITKETALPTIFFQGQLDKAVPFDSRKFTPCPSATMVYGTQPLYNRLKSLDETAIAHIDPQGGHGVFEEDFRVNNILCFLNNVRQGIKKQVYLTGIENSCDKQ